jgi:tripartite-type tricarboxylate transporter receptor subunit TctC
MPRTVSRRGLLRWAGAAAISMRPRPGWSGTSSGTWPDRVVKLEVGFPPGGGMDLAGRIVANGLSDIWGQQVVVENRPGAGGRIALDAAAHAPPDGYTMLITGGPPAINGLLFSSLSFDPVADFAALSLIGTYPSILVVPNGSPAKTLADFIAMAKANPGKVSWASPGIGSVPHLAGELFKRMAGIEITHVPYRGVAAGAMTDLVAGRVDAMFNTTASLLQPVRAGLVRGLAVTSAQRFPIAPELPAIAESGVPGYEATSWYALYVPAKTPAELITRMNRDIVAALRDDAARKKYEELGILVESSTPEELAAKNTADVRRWAPIIKAADIRME